MPLYRRRAAAKKSAARTAAKRKAPMRKRAMRPRRKMWMVKRYRAAAGAITNSLWAYGRRTVPKQVLALRRTGAPDVWHQNYSESMYVPIGLQQFKSFASLTRSQLTAIQSIVGNQTAPNRCLIENCLTELTFTNPTNAAVEVELYDIVPKRDLPNTIALQLNAGLYAGASSPESCITLGSQAASGVPPGSLADPSQYIGASPYDSQFFKDNFRVVQKAHLMLASGASHRHQAIVKVNRVSEQAVSANASLAYVKGLTYSTLICVRGAAAGIGGSPSGATTNQSTLNIVTSLRVKYTYVTDNNYSAVYYDQLPHDATPIVRNIGNGALESVTPA